MALKTQSRNRGLLLLHLLVRLLGLTGLLAALVGAMVLLVPNMGRPLLLHHFVQSFTLVSLFGDGIDPEVRWSQWAVLIGAAFVLLALLVELVVILRMVAVRRSAFAFNVGAQVVLALVLVVGINVYSDSHYYRLDWTQDREFTLAKDVQADLRQLKGSDGSTTIVVYKQHKTLGRLSDKPDALDYAAERKVVEKVEDLVQQLRDFGGKFKVVVLDVEDEGFEDQLYQVTKDARPLRDAIDRAVENSIFFWSKDAGRVQSLSFNDFYALDKTASQEASNLVLLRQGEQAFTNKLLNIDEKRPKIGILTIHELLTTEGPEELGLAGVKKALTARGFDVQDVVLKKWSETAPPEPAAYTYDESKYERLEEQLVELEQDVKLWETRAKSVEEAVQLWKTASLAELSKKYASQLGGRQVTQRMRELQLEEFERRLAQARAELNRAREERDTAVKEKAGLSVEGLAEQRRMTDIKAKLSRMLADFDLIIVPRMTLRNITDGDRIPTRVYRLDEAQVSALREYLKSGKPVLACFGPINEPTERFEPPGQTGPDGLEDLLTQLGVRLGKQTVLFNAESKSFAERRSGLLTTGANVEVPPVDFEWRPGAGEPLLRDDRDELEPHPIRESMRLVARGVGREPERRGDKETTDAPDEKLPPGRRLDLRLRHPRPIWFDPDRAKQLDYDPVFMMTSPLSWNDDNPFPSREHTPRLEEKADDPARGTPEQKRRGPFPIGVAVETEVPAGWYDKGATPAKVRVAVVGHGGLFVAQELSPVREKLLLNTVNWLLGRDDLLPRARDDQRWQYPRVALSSRDQRMWRWGTLLVLPGLFAYVGVVVLLVRRMR